MVLDALYPRVARWRLTPTIFLIFSSRKMMHSTTQWMMNYEIKEVEKLLACVDCKYLPNIYYLLKRGQQHQRLLSVFQTRIWSEESIIHVHNRVLSPMYSYLYLIFIKWVKDIRRREASPASKRERKKEKRIPERNTKNDRPGNWTTI